MAKLVSVHEELVRDYRTYTRRVLDDWAAELGIDYPRGTGPGTGNKFDLARLIDVARRAVLDTSRGGKDD